MNPAHARLLTLLLIGASAASSPETISAQATGLPTFFAPTRAFGSSEWGASLSRPGGGATGIEVRFGAALDRADLNLRAGYADRGASSDGSFVLGAEVRLPVIGRSQSFPLDGGFIFGVGYDVDAEQAIVPLGLSLGRRVNIDEGALYLTPFLQPTVVFASDSDFAVGLGIDVSIRAIPDIRVHWAVGDWDGFSVSLFWPS